MAEDNEFMRGWMSGWAAATNAITQSLGQALQGGRSGRDLRIVPTARADMAGNKPSGRRRGRPPRSAGAAQPGAPRRRGRPPKTMTP